MISDRIIELRCAAQWSQQELAKRMHISCKAVKNWEAGISEPFAKHIRQLAELFHVSTDYLLENSAKEAIFIDQLSPKNQLLVKPMVSILSEPEDMDPHQYRVRR